MIRKRNTEEQKRIYLQYLIEIIRVFNDNPYQTRKKSTWNLQLRGHIATTCFTLQKVWNYSLAVFFAHFYVIF